jgi:phytoene synthase
MDSMRVDCGPVRIAGRDELDRYMDGSAGAVGRILAPLLGCDDAQAVGDLGVAFQLANFLRDVREDWELDRVYVPGLPEDELAAGRMGGAARRSVAAETARARELFARAARVPDRCDAPVRPGMRLALRVYGGVLDRIEALGFDVLGGRAALAPWDVARAALGRRAS